MIEGSGEAAEVRVPGRLPWILLPACGAAWAAWHLRRTYFFFDEWSMIERVLHGPALAGTLASFNGHLWVLQYWIYRAQVVWFGVDDHGFVAAVFVCSLVALHLSLAALLVAARVPSVTSLLLAGVLTYLGRASQNFLFAVQASPTLSLAAAVAAAALVLDRRPSLRRGAAAGALLLASVGIDSGIAVVGVALGVVVAVLEWRSAGAAVAAPAIGALALWLMAADLGPRFPAGAAFAGHLLLRSIGAVAGRGELVGAVLLAASIAVVAFGCARGELDRPGRTLFVAGMCATAAALAAITLSRAGLPGFDFVAYNRYLQNVAIPASIALAPAWASVGRARRARLPGLAHAVTGCAAPALALAAFVIGVAPMREYADAFLRDNDGVRRGVRAAASVIREGCPSGAAPRPEGRPLGALSPQITTGLLRDLVDRGALRAAAPPAEAPEVVERMCPAPRSS